MKQQLDLAPIKARVAKATPGPWRYHRLQIHENARMPDGPTDAHDVIEDINSTDTYALHGRYICGFASTRGKYGREEANALFVANARTDVPALIEEVERLRALLCYTGGVNGWNDIPSFASDYPERASTLDHTRLPFYCINCQRKRRTKYLTDDFGPFCEDCLQELEIT